MKRIPLSKRVLPSYCKGEEIMNMVTHITGGGIGVIGLLLCLLRSVPELTKIICSCIYGCSLISLYTMSSVYHGLQPGTGKKVLQVLDHCTIYFLIAGTYTPIMVCAFMPEYPIIGWSLLAAEWGLAILAGTLTAIDLKRWNVFSMICYIVMGWGVIGFIPQAVSVLGVTGFGFLLAGGIAYTVGAVLYGIGSRVPWMHSVFHIFVVIGSILQLVTIAFFVL